MALATESASPERPALWQRPWPLAWAGLGTTILGLVLLSVTSLEPPRVILTGLGVIVAGFAVARRLQSSDDEDLEERVASAGLVVVCSLAALVAAIALQEWDSARLFFGVLFGVGLGGSLLVLLPSVARRLVLSLLAVVHFGCIVTAVTLVPPRNESAPWLSIQMWARFYRPYMGFMYLTNAYHFYSPDPGPANLFRFYIEYSDNTLVRLPAGSEGEVGGLPRRSDYKLNVQYQRMLALTEFGSQQSQLPLLTDVQIPYWEQRTRQHYPHEAWNHIEARRRLFGVNHVPALRVVDDVTIMEQYREPSDESKHFLASYARHLAMTTPAPAEHPDASVKSVRVYRLIHNILSPKDLAEGHTPDEPIYYWPYYMGRFDPSGKLLDPQDPCLYWLLPMTYVSDGYPEDKSPLRMYPPRKGRLIDCVDIHARLPRSEE